MLKVKDLMTKKIEFVMPDATVEEVAEIMEKSDVGIVPVCDEDKRLLGVVTDRDIVVRSISKKNKDLKVEDIMSKKITTASPNENIYDISRLMAKHKIRRIPIVENNILVGIVSISDIAITQDFNLEIAKAICEISK